MNRNTTPYYKQHAEVASTGTGAAAGRGRRGQERQAGHTHNNKDSSNSDGTNKPRGAARPTHGIGGGNNQVPARGGKPAVSASSNSALDRFAAKHGTAAADRAGAARSRSATTRAGAGTFGKSDHREKSVNGVTSTNSIGCRKDIVQSSAGSGRGVFTSNSKSVRMISAGVAARKSSSSPKISTEESSQEKTGEIKEVAGDSQSVAVVGTRPDGYSIGKKKESGRECTCGSCIKRIAGLIKTKWGDSDAKQHIRQCLEGNENHPYWTMMPSDLYDSNKLMFHQYKYTNFRSNLSGLKKSIASDRGQILFDEHAVKVEAKAFKREQLTAHGNPFYDTSAARTLLIQDVKDGTAEGYKHRPRDLRATKNEYKQFNPVTFTKHFNRELRRQKEEVGWQHKRNLKGSKKNLLRNEE